LLAAAWLQREFKLPHPTLEAASEFDAGVRLAKVFRICDIMCAILLIL
jgi:hypothetical protein